MKIIIFLIIIVILYFIATQIKLIHIDTLSDKQQNEINTKSRLKYMLTSDHIKCDDKIHNMHNKNEFFNLQSRNQCNDNINLPSGKHLFHLIKSNYLDNQYQFNIANQPTITRYYNQNMTNTDNKCLEYIRKNIRKNILLWNKIFENKKIIEINTINPIFIIETSNEFIIKTNVSLIYRNKTMHLQLTYYGQIKISDDFLNDGKDTYILQLTDIQPLKKSDYDLQIKEINEYDNNPFMTMQEQLQYVDKINQLHENEIDLY